MLGYPLSGPPGAFGEADLCRLERAHRRRLEDQDESGSLWLGVVADEVPVVVPAGSAVVDRSVWRLDRSRLRRPVTQANTPLLPRSPRRSARSPAVST